MDFYLAPQLKKYFSSTHPFEQLMLLRGECVRHQKGRLTQRIVLGEKNYFIKQHHGVGWKEIIKNVLQCRWPVISAKNEWCAIKKLQSVGVSVPAVVAFGQRGINPATQKSFILMEALAPASSLEEIGQTFRKNPPSFLFKYKLIKEIARIARLLHQHGMNHRDFYLCHFLLVNSLEYSDRDPIQLYLIDLHRAQIRTLTKERWVIKDLAGLYFSSKEVGLTSRDLYRFMKMYREKSLRDMIKTETFFWQKVKKRGEQLYRDHIK